MIENWQDGFAPQILARGKKYFEEGRVSQMIQYGNRITAHVTGTEDYCVEIDLPGGVPDRWLCSCPYAVKGNCKHKAAVLFAVEAGEYLFTTDFRELEEDIANNESDLPWAEAVEKMPADILRQFLLDYAEGDEQIQEYLSIWYLRGLPDGLLERWKRDLQSYARAIAGGRRYISEDEAYCFVNGVRDALNERLRLLRKVGATMDAFYWLGTVFEIASQKIYADLEGAFSVFYFDCAETWDQLFSEATEEQQEQMHAWFWEHRAAFFAHADWADDVDFLYHPWSEELEKKSLEIIDGLLLACVSDKERVLLMDCRTEIMHFLHCSREEVWEFWEKYLMYDYARNSLLDAYSREPEYHARIIPLLKRLKEMDGNDLPRLIKDSALLMKRYKEEGSEEAYKGERMLLFTQYRQMLESEIPAVLDRKSAKRFIACLDALRSIQEEEIGLMIEELVGKLCSREAIARKGIVEMINGAGYEWPKSYRFPG